MLLLSNLLFAGACFLPCDVMTSTLMRHHIKEINVIKQTLCDLAFASSPVLRSLPSFASVPMIASFDNQYSKYNHGD